jgi:hypothetical protein
VEARDTVVAERITRLRGIITAVGFITAIAWPAQWRRVTSGKCHRWGLLIQIP